MAAKRIPDLNRRVTFTLLELETIYGVPSKTIRKWIERDGKDGKPPLEAFKPGREIVVFKHIFEAYIKRFPASA